jgi:hypothetical protein
MSLSALSFSAPPPGYNFFVPSSTTNEYPDFPSLKLPEIDPKRYVLPSLEFGNQHNTSLPSSPLPFTRNPLPSPTREQQQTKSLFPDWFNQERDRIFGGQTRN